MSNWPVITNGMPTSVGVTSAGSTATTVTLGASGAKGAFAEISASTPHDSHGVYLCTGGTNGSGRVCVDIAVGASGSEVIVAQNVLFVRGSSVLMNTERIFLPITIPRGSRVSISGSISGGAVDSFACALLLLPPHGLFPRFPNRLTSANVDTTLNAATLYCDGGASVNTKGSYVELIASTPRKSSVALLTMGAASTMAANVGFLVDLAIGPSGSEVVVCADLHNRLSPSALSWSQPQFLPLAIPAGVRVAARCQASSASAASRLVGVILHLG